MSFRSRRNARRRREEEEYYWRRKRRKTRAFQTYLPMNPGPTPIGPNEVFIGSWYDPGPGAGMLTPIYESIRIGLWGTGPLAYRDPSGVGFYVPIGGGGFRT